MTLIKSEKVIALLTAVDIANLRDIIMNKIALVTGAQGSIGSATVNKLQAAGYTVIAADINILESNSSSSINTIKLDVRNYDEIINAMAFIKNKFGRLDILVNVAGITSMGSAAGITAKEWNKVLDINLTGSFWCCQAAIPLMQEQKWGRIINLGSVLGKNGGNARPWISPEEQATSGNIAYGVSKAGVHAMTAYLAKEVARDGITVNAVAPGPVASSMTTTLAPTIKSAIPIGRMGTAEEVAELICFLTSDKAGYVNGEVIDINGAMWCD